MDYHKPIDIHAIGKSMEPCHGDKNSITTF